MPAAAETTVIAPQSERGNSFIVNDTLYFIYGSLKFDNESNVIRKCESFYAISEIVKAKNDLFDAVQSFSCMTGVKNVNRQTRNDAGVRKTVEDIIFIFKKCDNDGVALPRIFSSDFCNIPRPESPDGLISKIDTVMSMLFAMQKTFITTESLSATLRDLRREFHQRDVVNDNGRDERSFAAAVSIGATGAAGATGAIPSSEAPSSPLLFSQTPRPSLDEETRQFQRPKTPAPRKAQQQSSRPRESSRRRASSKSRIIIGKKVNDGLVSFKGVDQTITKYIGHVENSVGEDDIRNWIEAGGVSVVELSDLVRRHSLWKSFKVTVKRSDITKIEDPLFWPGGVVVRPFYRPKSDAGAQSWKKDVIATDSPPQ